MNVALKIGMMMLVVGCTAAPQETQKTPSPVQPSMELTVSPVAPVVSFAANTPREIPRGKNTVVAVVNMAVPAGETFMLNKFGLNLGAEKMTNLKVVSGNQQLGSTIATPGGENTFGLDYSIAEKSSVQLQFVADTENLQAGTTVTPVITNFEGRYEKGVMIIQKPGTLLSGVTVK